MAKSKVRDLESLLKKSIGDDIEIINQEREFLTAPGEHYGSIMLSLKVKIRHTSTLAEETLNLVAKLIPVNETLRKLFDIDVTFKKEMLTYTQAIPTLVEFQKEYGVSEEDLYAKLFPKCLGARTSITNNLNQVDEDAVIIFENLKVQGYFTEDRLKGLDKISTNIILKDLAKFHAVPIALKLLKPDVFETKVKSCLIKNKGFESAPPEFLNSVDKSLFDGIKHWPELLPYLNSIEKIVENDHKNSFTNRIPQEPWGTIAHADFWTSNTMILKNEERVTVKNKLVDLQLINYWSCVTDLIFFLLTSVQDDLLDEHFDNFVRVYYESFVKNLTIFGIDLKPFSWESFQKELNAVAPTELYHVLAMLKPIFTERGIITNNSENYNDEDFSKEELMGPHHKNKIRSTVLRLVKLGWLK